MIIQLSAHPEVITDFFQLLFEPIIVWKFVESD